jgi:hypothetical protein
MVSYRMPQGQEDEGCGGCLEKGRRHGLDIEYCIWYVVYEISFRSEVRQGTWFSG